MDKRFSAGVQSTLHASDSSGLNTGRFPLTLGVTEVADVAHNIVSLELKPDQPMLLPRFEAGAHLDIQLSDGLIRQYSLWNDPSERDRYCIAVKKEPNSRGGSAYVHEHVRRGSRLTILGLRNNFPLPFGGEPVIMIAGGIGITPIRSMVYALDASQRNWHLHYCARSRLHAAFIEELAEYGQGRVTFWLDDEGRCIRVKELLQSLELNSYVLCCGPVGLMENVKSCTADLMPERVRFELFQRSDTPGDEERRAFYVELARSGKTLFVPADKAVLDVLLENGIDVPFGCHEGICGTCESRVLEGTPEHRDSVLSEEERRGGHTMMICVSRAIGDRLILDL